MNKLLFLDFDGVITAPNYRGGLYVPQIKFVRKLNKIIKETDCDIVISSSWRHSWSLLQLYDLLVTAKFMGRIRGGLSPNAREIDYGSRGAIINQWLLQKEPDVDQYCILDDNTDMLAGQWPHFVQVYHPEMKFSGLDDQDVARAIKILNSDIKPYIDRVVQGVYSYD